MSYRIRFAKFIQSFIEILFFIIDIQICFSVLHVSSLHQRRLQRFVYNACTYTLEVTSKIIFSKSLKMNINILKWFCRTRSHTHWYVYQHNKWNRKMNAKFKSIGLLKRKMDGYNECSELGFVQWKNQSQKSLIHSLILMENGFVDMFKNEI